MFRAEHLLWKNHPKVTLCCGPHPSAQLQPAPGSQSGDWMGLTCGASVATPKEGADTSTATFC